MVSFEQYGKRYFIHFLLDVCIVGLLALVAAFIALNHQKGDDKYWFWLVCSIGTYGLVRCLILLIWLVRSVLKRSIRLSIITLIYLIFLSSLSWAALWLVMLPVLGITPDGTEHRY